MSLWKRFKEVVSGKSTEAESSSSSATTVNLNVVARGMTPAYAKQQKVDKKAVHFPYDFDRWFARLKPFTFNSEVLAVSPELATAMIRFYQAHFKIRNALTNDDIKLLLDLEDRIQRSIMVSNAETNSTNGVFVRMSNRSPKDGQPLLEKGKTVNSEYESALRGIPDTDPNRQMVAICDVQMKILQCKDAAAVMNLLLTSERVFLDLYLALDCHEASKEDEWSTSVILREWQPKLRQDFEFRLFVCNNKVTAISQYNHWCVYDSMHSDDAQALPVKLRAFAEKVHPYIQQSSYVLDLAVLGDEIVVVELNPFDNTTGACMFDWRTDHDILHGMNNSDKPAFRVRHEVMPNLSSTVKNMLSESVNDTNDSQVESCSNQLRALSLNMTTRKTLK